MDYEYHINIQYQQKLIRTSLVYAWFQTLHHARVPRLIVELLLSKLNNHKVIEQSKQTLHSLFSLVSFSQASCISLLPTLYVLPVAVVAVTQVRTSDVSISSMSSCSGYTKEGCEKCNSYATCHHRSRPSSSSSSSNSSELCGSNSSESNSRPSPSSDSDNWHRRRLKSWRHHRRHRCHHKSRDHSPRGAPFTTFIPTPLKRAARRILKAFPTSSHPYCR